MNEDCLKHLRLGPALLITVAILAATFGIFAGAHTALADDSGNTDVTEFR